MGCDKFNAEGTLPWTSIPSNEGAGGVGWGGEQIEIVLLAASCYRNWDKLWPVGHLARIRFI